MVLQEQPKAGTTRMGRRPRGRGLILPHSVLRVHSSGTSGELIQARKHKEKSPGILHRGAQTPAHNPVVGHYPVLQQRRIPILFILFYFIETGFLCVSLAVLQLAVYISLAWNSQRSCLPLCLRSTGIKGMRNHSPADLCIFKWLQNIQLTIS